MDLKKSKSDRFGRKVDDLVIEQSVLLISTINR